MDMLDNNTVSYPWNLLKEWILDILITPKKKNQFFLVYREINVLFHSKYLNHFLHSWLPLELFILEVFKDQICGDIYWK